MNNLNLGKSKIGAGIVAIVATLMIIGLAGIATADITDGDAEPDLVTFSPQNVQSSSTNSYTVEVTDADGFDDDGSDAAAEVIIDIPTTAGGDAEFVVSNVSVSVTGGATDVNDTKSVSLTSIDSNGNPTKIEVETYDTDAGTGTVVGSITTLKITFDADSPSYTASFDWSVTGEDIGGNSDTDTGTLTVDDTAPTIDKIEIKETQNTSGDADTAVITFSEAIDDTSISGNLGEWELATITPDSFDTGANSDDEVVKLKLNNANEVDHTSAFDVTYTAGSAADLAGNKLADVGTGDVVESDAASPYMNEAAYYDLDNDALIEKIKAAYSEDISASTFELGDWALSTNPDGLSLDSGSISGSTVTFNVSNAPENDTNLGPTDLKYFRTNGTNNSITDGANAAADRTYSGVVDNASPQVLKATWKDTGKTSGDIDQVLLEFSEDVTIGDGVAGDGFPTIDIMKGTTEHTIVNANYGGSGTSLTLNLTDADEIPGTGISGLTVNYNGTETGTSLVQSSSGADGDRYKELAVTDIKDIALANVDSAAPAMTAQAYRDTDNDAVVETVVATYSENIEPGVYDNNYWALANTNPAGLVVKSGKIVNDTVSITVTGAAENDTDDANLSPINIDYNSSENIVDAAGKKASTADKTLVDEASPLVLRATWKDTNTVDGSLDQVVLDFSESVDVNDAGDINDLIDINDASGTDHTIDAAGYTKTGTSLTLDFDGNAITGTGISGLTVDYNGTVGGDYIVADGESNDAKYQEVSVNDITDVAMANVDSAAPYMTSAAYRDTDNDAVVETVVATYSENIEPGVYDNNYWAFTSTNPAGLVVKSGTINYDNVVLTVDNAPMDDTNFGATDIDYTSSENIVDAAGKKASSRTYSGLNDEANPVVYSVTIKDAKYTSGDVDTAEIEFTETVDDTTVTLSNWSIGGVTPSSEVSSADTDNILTLELADADEISGTSAVDVVTTASPALEEDDGSGALMTAAPLASADISEIDAAAPIPTITPTGTIHFRSPLVKISYTETVTVNSAMLNNENITDNLSTSDSMTFKYQTSSLADNSYDVTVVAVDNTNNSASKTRTFTVDTTYDISLEKGWNLFSLPLIPDNSAKSAVLSSISGKYTGVSYFKPGTGYVDPSTIEDGKAYWIEMTEAATLTVTGTSQPPAAGAMPSYSLAKGWNMLGFKSWSDESRSSYLGSATNSVTDEMYYYDQSVGYVSVGSSTSLTPGTGYWIAVSQDTTVYP